MHATRRRFKAIEPTNIFRLRGSCNSLSNLEQRTCCNLCWRSFSLESIFQFLVSADDSFVIGGQWCRGVKIRRFFPRWMGVACIAARKNVYSARASSSMRCPLFMGVGTEERRTRSNLHQRHSRMCWSPFKPPTAIVCCGCNNKFGASTIDFVQHVHDDILKYLLIMTALYK